MLNKLLKRCMPWQQKGKWVRIYVDWTDINNLPHVRAPEWLNVSIVDAGHGVHKLKCDPDRYYDIVTVKKTIVGISSDLLSDFEKVSYQPVNEILDGSIYPTSGCRSYYDMYMIELEVI